MKKKLIQFKNIVKSYEDGKVVLKGIDLDIYERICDAPRPFRLRENNAFAYFGRLFAGRSGRGAV